MAGGGRESTVATFLGGRAKRHCVHLEDGDDADFQGDLDDNDQNDHIDQDDQGINLKDGDNIETRNRIIIVIMIIIFSPTFKVDKNGEAPKLRRSSTISTRPAAAANCYNYH